MAIISKAEAKAAAKHQPGAGHTKKLPGSGECNIIELLQSDKMKGCRSLLILKRHFCGINTGENSEVAPLDGEYQGQGNPEKLVDKRKKFMLTQEAFN